MDGPSRCSLIGHSSGAARRAQDRVGRPDPELAKPWDADALWTALRCLPQARSADSHGYGIGSVPVRSRWAALSKIGRYPLSASIALFTGSRQTAVRCTAGGPLRDHHACDPSALAPASPLFCKLRAHANVSRATDVCLAKCRMRGSQIPNDPATLAISLPNHLHCLPCHAQQPTRA